MRTIVHRLQFAGLSIFVFAVAFAGAFSVPCYASSRMSEPWVVFSDYSTDTHYLGLNLGYNATDWLKLYGGYAFTVEGSTSSGAQGGVRFLVPDWDFSPFAGVSSGTSSGTLSLNIGLDYTSWAGLNLGAGYSHLTTSGADGLFVFLGYAF